MNEYVQLLTPRLAQYDFIGHNFVILFIPFLPQVCYFWKMCLRRYSRCLISRLESLHLEKRQLCSAATHNGKPSQPSPPPIQVALTESAGRGVFATRRIGAGDLIHTAKPIITHPTLSTLNSVCYFCLRKITSSSQHFQHHNARFCSEVCKDNAKVKWAFFQGKKNKKNSSWILRFTMYLSPVCSYASMTNWILSFRFGSLSFDKVTGKDIT